MKKINGQIFLRNYYLFFLTTLFVLAFANTNAQECIVYDYLTFSERQALGINEQEFQSKTKLKSKTNTIVPKDYRITPKKFRVNLYTQVIDNNTKVHLDYAMAVEYIARLNKTFESAQICFVLNKLEPYAEFGHNTRKYPTDVINIFISKNISYDGYFDSVDKIYLKEDNMWWQQRLIGHEVGHYLGLHHTQGPFNRPTVGYCDDFTQFNASCEHVTRDPNDINYNATTEGDFVYDTAADPGLFIKNDADYPNCKNLDSNGNYIGQQVDCQGTQYKIDNSVLHNIMAAYNEDAHRLLFTKGQIERMHYFLGDDFDTISNPNKKALILPSNITNVDLMMRNSELDYGVEPDVVSPNFWQSPDIWVRHANDNGIYHENPEYGTGNNYVKVRVVNRGCAPSDGLGKLKLYWTKAGTNLPMDVWEGKYNHTTGASLGDFIAEADLPVLQSYEEHVFTFPWPVPNPEKYSDMDEPWHFCLLAKIESPNDISALPENNGVYYHFTNSNNIALKNVYVINNTSSNSGKIHIGNFDGQNRNFKLTLSRDKLYASNTDIFREAEIKFTFDDKLWTIWGNSGFQGSNFSEFGDRTIIVNEDTEILLNDFPANDFGLLNVKINFLTTEYTDNNEFGFNVEHWDNDTNELMGGELYLVSKNERDLFNADVTIANNTLSAVTINEPAVYNWYDANGAFLHTGNSYNVNSNKGTYLLEVVSNHDGFKDTKEVTVAASNTKLIQSIYPNPATSNVTIQYNQLNCNNAYLMLVSVNNNTSANYILNLNSTSININTSQFTPDLYRVVLVCDNNVVESHNLIIQ